jgi:hypothetical protein
MIVDGRRIGYLLERVNRAAMRTLERHAPGESMTAAIVMEAYEEFLAGDFRKQMTEKFGIEYPLNFNVKDIKNT